MVQIKMPLVSIIIPSFNTSDYISDLINSIINQTYTNWELIIVDDHSQDNTFKIIKQYAETDRRIKGIRRPDHIIKGGDACRNYGFFKSTGEFIMFIDADDILAPYCLQQRVIGMINNSELDFGVFPALSFKKEPLDYNIYSYGFRTSDKALNLLINKALPFVVWNNIYRKESLINKKITWDEKLMSNQDADYNIQCLTKGLRFLEFDVLPDYFWRQLTSSTSKKMLNPSHFQSNIYYFQKISSLFCNSKEYSRDLKILSLWMFNVIRKAKNPKAIRIYLDCDYFKNHSLFSWKLRNTSSVLMYITSAYPKLYNIIITILFPYLSLVSRKYNGAFPFKYVLKKRSNVLTRRYKEYLNNCK